MFIAKDKVQWKVVNYLRQGETFNYDYSLILNEPLASWDVWDYWERHRVKSMEQNLRRGDILFDIGTEAGWCNIVYGNIVGFENMVLVEPTPEFWPNIKEIWYRNTAHPPLACFAGFFSNISTLPIGVLPKHKFPSCADGDLIDRNSYKYIHEHGNQIPQITLDAYCEMTGIRPNAITIDCEGSEGLILRGAEQTLANGNLKVWVSEHDDLMWRDYNSTAEMIDQYMSELGYTREVLGLDHERHVYYYKP